MSRITVNGTIKVKQQCQDRTRDMFLFCCFTGLSYADLAKVTNPMIDKAITQIEGRIGERFQFPRLPEENAG